MTEGQIDENGIPPFDDGQYEWPNLFAEADDMLQASLLMYPFAKLRQLAREGKLKNAHRILELPTTASHAIELLEENVDALKKQLGDEDVTMCQTALKAIHERGIASLAGEDGVELVLLSDAMLVAFGDDNSGKKLVYGVAVDSTHKRVTVAFRGSVTQTDFMTDACISMRAKKNLMSDFSDQDDMIKIHSGFNAYLLKMNKSEAENDNSKFDEVLNHVTPLFEKYPDYKLYVTGHSLGGALSTLFSFYVAASPHLPIPKPVTCISVASPKVGNESFRKAFHLLETQGKLRHLRIENERDPVTLVPAASSKLVLATLGTLAALSYPALAIIVYKKRNVFNEVYKHVGIKLQLLKEGKRDKFMVSHSRGSWRQDWFHPSAAKTVSSHYGNEYSNRLLRVKDELEKMTLNDLYREKN